MIAAIYSRKSKYVFGSESIGNQIEMCKEYLDKNYNNIEDVLIYEDEGFSGKNIDRPKFKKLIKDAEKNKFNILVCYRLDRISRNVADFSNTIEELQKHNIAFISIREQFDTSTPMGRAMMNIAAVFAQLERETIAERVRDNMLELAKTGQWLGGHEPLGYSKVEVDTKPALKVNDKAEIVKKIYKKYIQCDSISEVTKCLIQNNVHNQNGSIWLYTTTKIILTNPVYCIADKIFFDYAKKNEMIICKPSEEFQKNKFFGVMPFNKKEEKNKKIKFNSLDKWIISIGKHQGIISSKDWIYVQNRIKINAEKSPRTGTGEGGLLSGLLRCKKCNSTMKVFFNYKNGKKTQHYYRCKSKVLSKGKICNINNINGAWADNAVLEFLKKIKKNPKLIDKIFGLDKIKNLNQNLDKDIKKLETQIKLNFNTIKQLTKKLIYTDDIGSKYIGKQINELGAEIEKAKSSIKEIKSNKEQNEQFDINKEFIVKSLNILFKKSDILIIHEQKNILKKIIQTIYWDGDNLDIKFYT